MWTKYGQLFDKETITIQVNAESSDFYTRPLFSNEIMYDAELKDIITLINEEGYEYSAFLIKIMEYIIKNRSLVTKNDAIRADLQNKLSELYYK